MTCGNEKRRPMISAAFSLSVGTCGLEQAEHRLFGLLRDRQRDRAELLASLERQQVGRFFVEVGIDQIRRAALEGVDEVLGEVFTNAQQRGVGTKGLRNVA